VTTHLCNHFAHLAKLQPGATVQAGRFGLMVDSGLDCDTFNVVVTHRPDWSLAPADVLTCLAQFGRRRFSWRVGPKAPPETTDVLARAGLEPQPPEGAMSKTLTRETPEARADLEIVRVTTRARLQTYAAILAQNWTPLDPDVIRYYAAVGRRRFAHGSPLVLLLARKHGEPVGTAELALGEGGVAGLYNVATLVAHRRRGVATALAAHALMAALDAGMQKVELQASNEGKAVYEKLGFRAEGAWVEHTPVSDRGSRLPPP
jgi:GNAT superfamily N-acetyltransferase